MTEWVDTAEPRAPAQLPLLGGLDGILSGCVRPAQLEHALAAEGIGPVVAIDEAGRGPLAGPVVAAAVAFPGPCGVRGVNDSKQLSPQRRRALVPQIRRAALAWGIGLATAEEIDAINILEATRLASERAIAALGLAPAVVLTDALTLPRLACPVVPIVRGDARVRAIGAASILAKEWRDALMRRLARLWPQYGFDQHFGYSTDLHQERLAAHGPSTIHRLTFHGAGPQPGRPLVPSRLYVALREALANGRGKREALQRRIARLRRLCPARECEELTRLCSAL